MASVQAAKRKLQSKSLVEKYQALKEIEEGYSCISITKKYGVAKNTISHWLKNSWFGSWMASVYERIGKLC